MDRTKIYGEKGKGLRTALQERTILHILTCLCQRIDILLFRVDLRETKPDILSEPLHGQKVLLKFCHISLCVDELIPRYHLMIIVPILGGEVNVID